MNKKEEDLEQLRINRALEEQENLNLSLKELEDVFVSQSIVSILGKAKDPLQQALILIGHFMKIKFVFPRNAIGEEGSLKSIEERLDSICQASQIQKRKIKLAPNWWQQNHGSLLAFYHDGNRPVSMIRLDKYKSIDALHNEYMNSEQAEKLTSTGFMFYRRLDSRIKKGRDALLFFYRNYYKELIKIIPIGILGVLFALFPPVATEFLFAYAIPGSDHSMILYLTFGLIFSAIGFSFFYLLQEFVYLKMEGLGVHLIQTVFWDRLLRLSPRFFRKFTVGNLFSRIFSIDEMRAYLNSFASSLATTIVFAILYLVMMAFYSPILSLVAFVFAVLGLGISALCSRAQVTVLKQLLEVDGNLDGIVIQMIQGIGKLRVAGVDKSAFAYWASYFAKNNSLKLKVLELQNINSLFSTIVPVLSVWSIYFVLLEWLGTNSISLPNFLAFNIAFGSFSLSLYPINNAVIQMANLIPLWDRTKVILEEPLEQQDRAVAPGKLTGDIRVENLVFSYEPDRPPILENLSLTIKPGEFIGIVGKTGCGKSTLIRLLLGFEKPNSGVIFFEGVDVASLDLQDVRRQLGVVLQGGGMMAGSVYEILSSGGTYSEEEFTKALSLSGFDEDLATLPMGFNTVIPLNATTLSSGQKQRLLLARALIGNPSILIFDEATSSLDNKSQEKIVSNMEKLNVTRIAIAQRLSTIKNATRIYVIDKGTVVKSGTFHELSKAPGLFAEMLSKQTGSKI